MNYKAQQIIQKELAPKERLLWAGMPKQGFIFTRSDLLALPFRLLWAGFALMWEIMTLRIPRDAGMVSVIFPLFGVPFVLFGMYQLFGRFLHDAKKRANTFYGLTDTRAIIVSEWFGKTVESIPIKTMCDIRLEERADGYGTIIFGSEKSSLIWGNNPFYGNCAGVPKFEHIENAKQVYDMLFRK